MQLADYASVYQGTASQLEGNLVDSSDSIDMNPLIRATQLTRDDEDLLDGVDIHSLTLPCSEIFVVGNHQCSFLLHR